MNASLSLSGVVPPMITPLRARDELDGAGLERLVEHILAGGVHGLFILGTTGEGPSLGYRLRRELVERTCRLVRGRVPVLVGITDTAFVESVALARHAADCGAAAVVAAPPYYLPEGQPELLEYFDHLTAELPLPLVLYNFPALTKVAIEPETVRRAFENPRIVALKDSSGSLTYLHQVLRLTGARPDRPVLVGEEQTLAYAMQAGAHGGVNGGANMFPRLYTAFFEAARAGDAARVRRLQDLVIRVADIYRVGRHSSSGIKGIKCVLSLTGVCDDFMAEPFHRFLPPERERVATLLAGLKPCIEDATRGPS